MRASTRGALWLARERRSSYVGPMSPGSSLPRPIKSAPSTAKLGELLSEESIKEIQRAWRIAREFSSTSLQSKRRKVIEQKPQRSAVSTTRQPARSSLSSLVPLR